MLAENKFPQFSELPNDEQKNLFINTVKDMMNKEQFSDLSVIFLNYTFTQEKLLSYCKDYQLIKDILILQTIYSNDFSQLKLLINKACKSTIFIKFALYCERENITDFFFQSGIC